MSTNGSDDAGAESAFSIGPTSGYIVLTFVALPFFFT